MASGSGCPLPICLTKKKTGASVQVCCASDGWRKEISDGRQSVVALASPRARGAGGQQVPGLSGGRWTVSVDRQQLTISELASENVALVSQVHRLERELRAARRAADSCAARVAEVERELARTGARVG